MQMIPLIDQIKTDLTLFVEEASSDGTKFYMDSVEPLIFSPQLHELMEFLEELLDKNKMAHRFNYQMRSVSISDSSKKINSVSFYRKEDYYLPFLHHLAIQDDKVSAEDLNDYINGFLHLNAELFSVHDTFILKSGATRAVANIRFATNFLRNQTLIENRTIHGRRSLQPTMLGILTLILMKLKMNDKNMLDMISLNHDIVFYNFKSYYCYYPWRSFRSPEELITSLEKIKALYTNKVLIERINRLISEYYSFIADQINLDNKTGKLKLKLNFDENFLRFINSEVYNWDHTDAIIMLRHAYRNLWGLENEKI
jgi:hypothetical protein